MSNEVATMGMDRQIVVTPEQVGVIKNTVAAGATDDELKLFIYDCQRRGVHPLDKMIHFVKRGTGDKAKATHQAGIDFMRALAEETGEYRGQRGPEYELKEDGTLESASVTVLRKIDGDIVEFTAQTFWDEYYPGDVLGFMWKKMPRVMLGKCAEVAALRKAFPRKLQGLYSPEEMAQTERLASYGRTPARPSSPPPTPPRTITTTATRNDTPPHPADDGGECAEGIPISDKVEMALAHICQGDQEQMKRLLMEASRGGKDSGAFLAFSKLSGANTGWLKRIYEYLEPMLGVEDREPGMEG